MYPVKLQEADLLASVSCSPLISLLVDAPTTSPPPTTVKGEGLKWRPPYTAPLLIHVHTHAFYSSHTHTQHRRRRTHREIHTSYTDRTPAHRNTHVCTRTHIHTLHPLSLCTVPNNPSTPLSAGVVAGLSVVSVMAVLVVIFLILCVVLLVVFAERRRRRRRRWEKEESDWMPGVSDVSDIKFVNPKYDNSVAPACQI